MTRKQRFLRRIALCTALGCVLGAATLALPVSAQKAFPSPEAAAEALVDGIARHDHEAVKSALGADFAKVLPIDDIDPDDVTDFLEGWSKSHRIVAAGDAKALVEVGVLGWTMPVPLVRSKDGWQFDVEAGADEMRTRRIGRNELAVIQAVLAYADAQDEYAAQDRDGDGMRDYARRLRSSPGKRDGLYWPVAPGEPQSPLGPLLAETTPGVPYYGYRYRILTAEGKGTAGGAVSYVVDGRMTGGYALVAWPAAYGDTGVMTFIVNQDRVVYEKDLGPDTDRIARTMTAYAPDETWSEARPAP